MCSRCSSIKDTCFLAPPLIVCKRIREPIPQVKSNSKVQVSDPIFCRPNTLGSTTLTQMDLWQTCYCQVSKYAPIGSPTKQNCTYSYRPSRILTIYPKKIE